MYEKLTKLIGEGDYREALYEFQEEFLHIDEKNGIDAAKLCVLEASIWEALGDDTAEFDAIARGIAYDGSNYELFYMLGLYYKDINVNQAYLCMEMALFYCDNEDDKQVIKNECDGLATSAGFRVRGTSIMILSYNDLDLIKRCIESIEEYVPKDSCEIVIVDNASDEPGVSEYLDSKKKESAYDIKFFACEENLGFPKGCNLGTKYCNEENDVFYLNNDACLTRNALFFLRMGLYSGRNVGAVGPLSNSASLQEIPPADFYRYAGEELSDMWQRKLGVDRSIEVFKAYAADNSYPMRNAFIKRFRLTGFALLLANEAISEVAPDFKVFDELFSPGYFEDDDLGIRLAKAGFVQYVCKNSFVYHNGGSGFEGPNDALEAGREKFKEKWGFDIWGYSLPWFEVADEIIALVKEKRGSLRIVDFTCGFGATASYIKSSCPETFIAGVCRNSFEAGIAQNLADDVAWGDTNTMRLPWSDRSFDVVIAQKGDVSMGQVMRYLKPDGKWLGKEDTAEPENENDIINVNATGFDSEKIDDLL
ncbi:MAG: glycosyltransferase family 2 protein [Butyrivibrio sp.]|nr:glycosyltransferase family 2 protein [Butyrivibrio sp.]